MLLRASGEAHDEAIDLRAVTEGAKAKSGLAGGEALTAFAEASVRGEREAISSTRERVERELGAAATVDAAGVIGNFERMVRIADATGIPLDRAVALVSADMRADLGIDGFGGARSTRPVRGLQRLLGRVMVRMMPLVLRRFRS
ncbi:MAG: hypothetical protein JRH17_20680 [Deltaproteobacteria bacterium]|nr:hypothetical protein [Deltaproteobacteria bacterium]